MKANVWKIRWFPVGGKNYYFVYRLKSLCATDETGNRIYKGGNFETAEDAKKYADELNEHYYEVSD